MKVRYLVAMTVALTVSACAWADDGEALFKKSGCSACHAVDKKLVGPAFKDVAAKYAGNGTAQATLEKKVRTGGSGSWGKIPMPPAAKTLTDDNIKALVTWVLSRK